MEKVYLYFLVVFIACSFSYYILLVSKIINILYNDIWWIFIYVEE